MNRKLKFFTLSIAAASMALITSCQKDDDPAPIAKPQINNLEIGYDNDKIGIVGGDLHLDAEIVAEGTIAVIEVELHNEAGMSGEIVTIFTGFAGLKNTDFHEHIEIPEGTPVGDYHFHMKVIDQQGNSTEVEDEVMLQEADDTEAPVITISSAPADMEHFHTGETITISGTVTDNDHLDGLLIALVYEDDNIADTDVTAAHNSVIVMLHGHDFDSETSHNFTASIDVGAAMDNNDPPAAIGGDNAWKDGEYYILVKSTDHGGNWGYSNHYHIDVHN